MPQPLESLDLVRHTCLIPDSDEHIWEATAAWITSGIRAGERVLYFEDETADRLLTRLEDDRVPVASAMADGQFAVIPTEMTRATVTVPLDQVEQVMHQAVEETAAQGWPGLRFVGESARARLDMGLDMLVGYETIVERVLLAHPQVRLLCLYDRRVFDEQAIAAMRRIHRTELVTEPIYDDGLLRVTRPEPGKFRFAGEIDYSNRILLRRLLTHSLENMLRSVTAPDDVTLDLASVRFLDVSATTELLHLAREFPRGHHLVLEGVRPHLRRLLHRVDQPPSGRLVLPPRWASPEAGPAR